MVRAPIDTNAEAIVQAPRPGQVREPRAAWPREILSAVALGKRHQNVGQGRGRRDRATKPLPAAD